MYTVEQLTETNETEGKNFAFNEISAPAKNYVRKAWQQTSLSPLAYIRMMQENCSVHSCAPLKDAEIYLINEE